MTKEQEAQQAQIIAEIKAAAESYKLELREYDLNTRQTDEVFVLFEKAIEIADSQAQKIAEQAKKIERLKDLVRKISGAEPDPFNIVAGVRRSHNKQQTAKR